MELVATGNQAEKDKLFYCGGISIAGMTKKG